MQEMAVAEAWTFTSNLQNDHISLLIFNPDDRTYLFKNMQECEVLHGAFLPGGPTTIALNTWNKVMQNKLNEVSVCRDVVGLLPCPSATHGRGQSKCSGWLQLNYQQRFDDLIIC